MRGGEALRWVGFDTETFRGEVKLLASSSGRFLENGTTEQFLKFLWEEMPNLHDAGVFYNLRFDASAILRDAAKLTPDAVRSGDFVVGQYHVHHVPGKAPSQYNFVPLACLDLQVRKGTPARAASFR